MLSAIVEPTKLATVRSIPIFIIGNKIGNASTGNSAFLEFAFAIIAEITVVAVAIAKDEIVIVNIKRLIECTICVFKNKKKKVNAKKFMNRLVKILKISLPK